MIHRIISNINFRGRNLKLNQFLTGSKKIKNGEETYTYHGVVADVLSGGRTQEDVDVTHVDHDALSDYEEWCLEGVGGGALRMCESRG